MAASRVQAESDMQEALRNLQNALRKDTRSDVEQITFPRFENTNAVEKNAADLQDSVERLIELRGIKRGSDLVKEYVRKWYRASYPFARLFITVAKEGAAVFARKVLYNLVDTTTQSVWPRLWRTSRSHGGVSKVII